MDTATCGASAGTCLAASYSTTGATPMAWNSSTTPMATSSPPATKPTTCRSSCPASGPGATTCRLRWASKRTWAPCSRSCACCARAAVAGPPQAARSGDERSAPLALTLSPPHSLGDHMAVQVVRYLKDRKPAWGVVHDRRVAPLSRSYASTADFVGVGIDEAWASTAAQASLSLDELQLLSPVTDDRQFVCQGINYASHVRESGMNPDHISFNTLFTKAPSCLTSARADVVRPAHVSLLDYEVELGDRKSTRL